MPNLDMETEQRSKMILAYSAQHAAASAGLPCAASSQGGCGGWRGTVCWQRHKGGASHSSSSRCSLGHLRSHGTKRPGASSRCRRRFDAKWLQNTQSDTSVSYTKCTLRIKMRSENALMHYVQNLTTGNSCKQWPPTSYYGQY